MYMLCGAEVAVAVDPLPLYNGMQEWSPLAAELEGQMHAELAALRAGIFLCMPQLAARLTDAQHLLEVLGGIAAKMTSANPSFAAVLECMLAALQTLHSGAQVQTSEFLDVNLAHNSCLAYSHVRQHSVHSLYGHSSGIVRNLRMQSTYSD